MNKMFRDRLMAGYSFKIVKSKTKSGVADLIMSKDGERIFAEVDIKMLGNQQYIDIVTANLISDWDNKQERKHNQVTL